jgi:hypothetical protein
MNLSAADLASPEPRINRILSGLQDWEFDTAQGLDLEDQDVYLDGREFIDCSFRNCNMYITMGYFRMINPRAFVDCRFYLAGPAEIIKTLVDIIEGRLK